MAPANPLETLPLVIALHESPWFASAIRVAHALGFATLVATVITFDLRVLGFWRDISVRALSRKLLPWSLGAVVLIVPTGSLLFLSKSGELIGSRLLVLKMALIGAAAINAIIFRTGPYQSVKEWDTSMAPPAGARFSVALSIALWLSVIACGKILASR